MDKVIIARMGVEGGGITVYGSQSNGVWSFWTEGSSMCLDDNDDEAWQSWTSEPVKKLDLVLPKDWPIFYPVTIDREFVEWFRTNYEAARASMHEDQRRYQEQHPHRRWSEVLSVPS
jgi:hypothetical protein